MRYYKTRSKTPTRILVSMIICMLPLSGSIHAMPANAEAEFPVEAISESDFETELGLKTVYFRLLEAARKTCDIMPLATFLAQDKIGATCVYDTIKSYVDAIGNDKLLAYHARESRKS